MEENEAQQEKTIFREAAVESFSTTNFFEYYFKAISYRKWMVNGALILLMTSGLTWLFIGTFPLEIKGVGISMNLEGLFLVESPFSGFVIDLKARSGQVVQKGELIAILSNKKVESLEDNNIYSPVSGLILEWLIQPNQYIETGDSLARLERQNSENRRKVFLGYFPITEEKKIQLNTEVSIELSTLNRGEYGAILGNIISLSPALVTHEDLELRLHDPALSRYLMQGHEAVIEVVIEPQRNPNTESGYRWTSCKGAPIELSSGILCEFQTAL